MTRNIKDNTILTQILSYFIDTLNRFDIDTSIYCRDCNEYHPIDFDDMRSYVREFKTKDCNDENNR